MSNTLNNLSITVVNGAMSNTMGHLVDYLQGNLANWGRDRNCRFYYQSGGGSLLQVATRSLVGGALSALKGVADDHFTKLINGKRKNKKEEKQIEQDLSKQEEEKKNYGKIMVKPVDGDMEVAVYALDDWGNITVDALMLAIDTDTEITITQEFPNRPLSEDGKTKVSDTVKTKTLVWYDTTAIINISSDKNLVITKVTGRDYSRKELVSNGDVKFQVSGQITSPIADIYPTEEIQKFRKIMQYKGIIRVNNQVLDQFGVENIIITDFNISSKEGYKAVQSYTFTAIGLQPQFEHIIKEDTIKFASPDTIEQKEDSDWLKMFKNKYEGLKLLSIDLFTQGTAIGSTATVNSISW